MNSNQLMWQERFNIGVEVIDKEHQKLFGILRKLLTFSKDPDKKQWVCQEGIKYFQEHAIKHFSEEEVYMASIGYHGYDMHRRLHDNFRKKTLPGIQKELEQTNYSDDAVEHFLGVCVGWLVGHTLTEDHAITGKALSKWVGLLPEEEQETMKQVIIELLYEMFRLKAHLISESYGGEKFGKGVYYRLVYGSKEGKTWEIFLVFEERLLLSTIGGIMGSSSNKLDVMMMNMTRYTAQQFMERIRAYIPSAGLFEIKEENLLTYEQFEKIFGRHTPQSSLLFDTGEGYFAYCVMAPHLLEEMKSSSIKAENAVDQIKRYLKNSDTSKKKKVLVVDDSIVVRQAMQELLGKDYEVVTAESGLSAIRCMILDRPDLVLLDYEMPVCSGRQVLEMIRSEKELADIPVIFLTNTVDRESVAKVVSLKPADYLLKTTKPKEIKKSIDKFFQKQAG